MKKIMFFIGMLFVVISSASNASAESATTISEKTNIYCDDKKVDKANADKRRDCAFEQSFCYVGDRDKVISEINANKYRWEKSERLTKASIGRKQNSIFAWYHDSDGGVATRMAPCEN